ncbi:MAG: hypothetical protein ACRD2D_08150 [Terriglobales bacterium]
MSSFIHLVTMAIPVAAMGLAAVPLLRCRHPHEIYDRYPDGRSALRCDHCLRLRPNILAAALPQYRRTQSGGAVGSPDSGIEKVWSDLDRPITDFDLFGLKAGQ